MGWAVSPGDRGRKVSQQHCHAIAENKISSALNLERRGKENVVTPNYSLDTPTGGRFL